MAIACTPPGSPAYQTFKSFFANLIDNNIHPPYTMTSTGERAWRVAVPVSWLYHTHYPCLAYTQRPYSRCNYGGGSRELGTGKGGGGWVGAHSTDFRNRYGWFTLDAEWSAGSLSNTRCIASITLAAGSRRAAADANVNGGAWRGIQHGSGIDCV